MKLIVFHSKGVFQNFGEWTVHTEKVEGETTQDFQQNQTSESCFGLYEVVAGVHSMSNVKATSIVNCFFLSKFKINEICKGNEELKTFLWKASC